ncbi:hypothetical protein J4418_03940 [Candidatus Woesearchaeota archaeon]|nr:hypothetical protein [Candidatus Woesearchaeota archaeon]
MRKNKYRKIGKKESCPPEWCPRLKYERCCIICEYHHEEGKPAKKGWTVYCKHSKAFL